MLKISLCQQRLESKHRQWQQFRQWKSVVMSAFGKADFCSLLWDTKGWWLLPLSRLLPYKHTCLKQPWTNLLLQDTTPLYQGAPCVIFSQSWAVTYHFLAQGGTDISNVHIWNQRMAVGSSFQFPWFRDESLHLLCLYLPSLTSLLLWATEGHSFTASPVASFWELGEFSKGSVWTELWGSRSVAFGIAPFILSLYTDNKQSDLLQTYLISSGTNELSLHTPINLILKIAFQQKSIHFQLNTI